MIMVMIGVDTLCKYALHPYTYEHGSNSLNSLKSDSIFSFDRHYSNVENRVLEKYLREHAFVVRSTLSSQTHSVHEPRFVTRAIVIRALIIKLRICFI